MNAVKLLSNNSKRFPDKPAIIFKDQEISFRDLEKATQQWAAALQQLGVSPGIKFAIYLPNWPEYIYSYLAVFSLGAVVVPLDFMLTQNEIINFINHSDSKILIAKERKGIDLESIKRACPQLEKIIIICDEEVTLRQEQGFIDWKKVKTSEGSFVAPGYAPQNPAAIFYTSGSTGHPKGVLLSYAHLDNPIRCIEHFLHPTDKDSYLCAGVPFSHIGGLDYMLFMLHFGSTLILLERFQPMEALKHIEKYHASIFCIVPSMFIAIVSLKESEKFDLSALHYAVVFGAPSSPDLLKRFHQLCPNAILANGWGMTETAAPNTYSPLDVSKIHSIGSFGAGMEAKIVTEDGQELPAGEKGELWVRGDAVMVGYYKEEDLTREVLTTAGWLKTGDIAVRDAASLYYLVGRKKDMIKVAGEIVFSPEVEAVILRHPQVQDVAVIGIPDKMRGEVPLAFIVPKPGETIVAEAIKSFCREHLAHFKLPHRIEIRNDLPRNRMGKIDKEALKRL